jgi:hypothetical protein
MTASDGMRDHCLLNAVLVLVHAVSVEAIFYNPSSRIVCPSEKSRNPRKIGHCANRANLANERRLRATRYSRLAIESIASQF